MSGMQSTYSKRINSEGRMSSFTEKFNLFPTRPQNFEKRSGNFESLALRRESKSAPARPLFSRRRPPGKSKDRKRT